MFGTDAVGEPRRRLLPRQPVEWEGEYVVGDDGESSWQQCRILDVSSGGVGVELIQTNGEVAIGQEIRVVVELRGEIRHTRRTEADTVVLGAEFVGISGAMREYFASLAAVNARW